ncbi:MAG: spore cortex-lytic enzyme [Christensenellales bacterium]|jgi:N-acetylmuramoyl-L-alanine amidase
MKDKAKLLFVLSLILLLITTGVFINMTYPLSEEAEEVLVLKQGSTGSQVRTIQSRLKAWGYYTGQVDGIFGPKTRAAVVYFQKKNGLQVDGIIGRQTAAALGISLAASSSSNSSYSGSDEYLLAKVVYSEARGEPYTGMVAVAAVVLNRVRHPDFPNTISGVVYQPWAFTAVHDGQINLTPNETSKRAARDALNGWDPTNGSLFYYNPRTATNSWIRSKRVITVIGSHYFCA